MARFAYGRYVDPLQLRVGSGGRCFTKSGGSPFPLFVDSGWEHARMQSSGWQSYLDSIAALGYNATFQQGPLAYFYDQADDYGNAWFNGRSGNTWDLTQPNTAAFANQRAAVDYAAGKGVLELVWPAYAGYYNTPEGIIDGLRALTGAQAQAYGAYIGALYNTAPNVVYVLGGDHFLTGANKLSSADLELYRRLVVGIKSADRAGRIFTWHAARGESSYELNNITAGYIAALGVPFFDFAYARGEAPNTAHKQVLDSYVAGRPVAMLEDQYENGTAANADAALLRRETWGSYLSGACGHAFGDANRYEFQSGWQATLSRAGVLHDSIAIAFFKALAQYIPLVPSTGDGLVTAATGGTLDATSYKPRAMSYDRKVGLVYAASAFTVDKSKFPASFVPRWFDPTNGQYTAINGGASLANSGTQSYTPPTNAAGGADMIWRGDA